MGNVPSLGYKDKHVCHYQNLKLYLQLGMKIEIDLYINFNTGEKKVQTLNLKKLMSKNISGKTMESLRNSVDLILATISKDYQKIVFKLRFL